jgi:hypothetical protein
VYSYLSVSVVIYECPYMQELLVKVGFEEFQLELLPSELCHEGRDGVNGPYSSGIGRWRRV